MAPVHHASRVARRGTSPVSKVQVLYNPGRFRAVDDSEARERCPPVSPGRLLILLATTHQIRLQEIRCE
jgi:hypothetical protein